MVSFTQTARSATPRSPPPCSACSATATRPSCSKTLAASAWVAQFITAGKQWLESSEPKWEDGLNTAESLANLLEANQLVAMREPPTRAVDQLRKGDPNVAALKTLMTKLIAEFEPYQRPAQPN